MIIREQILERMVTVLGGVTDVGGRVYRSREEPITRENTPSIVLAVDEEQVSVFSPAIDRHELIVDVEIFVRADPWDAIANQVWLQANHLLMTDSQLSVIGSLRNITAAKMESEEADLTAGVLTTKYRITFLTKSTDHSVLV